MRTCKYTQKYFKQFPKQLSPTHQGYFHRLEKYFYPINKYHKYIQSKRQTNLWH